MIKTLSDTNTQSQRGPESDGNEAVLRIPQRSRITEGSQSDCLMAYQDTCWCRAYLSPEKQSVYSTAPVDWARRKRRKTVFSPKPTHALFLMYIYTPTDKV